MAQIGAYKRCPFAKLDELCSSMASSAENGGLRLHQQKYYRASVPQAFTGGEFLQWLMDRMHLDDNAEAVHMAGILCQHGYLFSVTEPINPGTVKDDGTLYRLQHDSREITGSAIYLNKRLMRNEKKHGLDEHEAHQYNNLMDLLGHMWDFITTQAESELKSHKDKRKSDKVVRDSQERTFWRLIRPPSTQPNVLEDHQCKLARRIRKRTPRYYQQMIDRLKFSQKTKPWLKSPKSAELLVTWSEQFQEYDPLLLGTSQQPSNPWISEDQQLWILNADYVEVPTERRVKRWGLSVQELVKDPIGRQILETFLESEFSSENIRFWLAVQSLKCSPSTDVPDKVDSIYSEYLTEGAPCQVNVDSKTLTTATSALSDTTIPKRYAFSQAEEHVFTLMSKDSYPRFLRSDIYKNVLNAAQQQGSKRLGWRSVISFGAGGAGGGGGGSAIIQKKISSTPQPSSVAAKTTTASVGGGSSLSSSSRIPRDDNSTNSIGAKQFSTDSLLPNRT